MEKDSFQEKEIREGLFLWEVNETKKETKKNGSSSKKKPRFEEFLNNIETLKSC